jgi:alpha-beta hydrolase superfamily lysophospholipase
MTDAVFGERSTVRTVAGVATLVRVPAERATRGAMLFVHGFADYFFQAELAGQMCALGFEVYGIDLRAYGRSLRDGQLPNYVTDLAAHFEELDEAAKLIRADGHRRLVVVGHSTGGLIAALWADRRRAAPPMDALVLNSPWLDLAEPFLSRTVATWLLRVVGRFAPTYVIRPELGDVYGQCLHRDFHGEWEYDFAMKPLAAFPVRAGWLRAIRAGHRAVRRGLAIPVPVLVLHSTRSLLHVTQWSEAAMTADTVLDVGQIARLAPRLGPDVRAVPVEGAMHDVFLSAPEVRAKAVSAMTTWLDEHVPADTTA